MRSTTTTYKYDPEINEVKHVTHIYLTQIDKQCGANKKETDEK